MKARVSHLLQAVGILFMIIAMVSLFISKPMRFSSFEQRKLYESTIYQQLEEAGIATKAVVSAVINESELARNLLVKFFTQEGKRAEAYILLTKIAYNEGDLVNIVYNPENTQQARIAPKEEMELNWPLFGWCMVMGIILFWLGHFRYKVSGGLE
ncbi:DUF3592 domain-containing protein [Entomomonas asaccharolytica]|uniref:DUF3592 domain-containing protein n=1 Tax=Entomomonas asaccharolytica TaxID=2785331 RepID=A0A974NDK4_9GAMM|nr:DUF3592 domain-containing protein [Entomomonas asaccharolytica]QQP84721.1 hypothetical protein JHT90_09910 [Entomomonas asaccharolytica]